MPYADLGDLKIYYKEYSSEKKETILFLHGFTLDHRMWEADAEYLSQFFHVIIIDMKGHGKSTAPQTGYSRAHRVEDVIKFMDALNLEKAHLVGLSYGGTTVLGVAIHHPERVFSLTLASTSAAGYKAAPRLSKIDKIFQEKGTKAGKDKWINIALTWYKDDKPEIRQLMMTMMTEHSYTPWVDLNRGKYPREYDFEKVTQLSLPVMIIAGELDKMFLTVAEKLHELIPSSKLHIYDKVGHMVNLEAPEKFHLDLLEFIKAD